MKLIIVRHGETEGNLVETLQGHLPGMLTQRGIEQAKRVALRLKDEHIDAIYSSDLRRARDTAKEIAKYHPHIKVHYTRQLRERYFGKFQGQHKSKIDWANLDPSVENDEALTKRAQDFFEKLYSRHKNETLAIVTHGGIQIFSYLFAINKKYNELPEPPKTHNTGVTMIEILEDKSQKVHFYNCDKHLK